MGADGHIAIYDEAKFEEKFGKESVEKFLEEFLSGKFYVQELSGKGYLTRYWGDNYGSSDTFDVVRSCYSREKDSFNTKNWDYDSYAAERFMKFTKKERKKYSEMIDFLDNDCQITQWEVWT